MTVMRSELEPQSPYWYEDLPGRTASLSSADDKLIPDVGNDLLRMDDHCLELSRVSSMQRGAGLLFGVVMLIGMLSVADTIALLLRKGFSEAPAPTIIFACGLLAFLVAIAYLIKKEVRTPRDLPVRFYRNTGRIVSLDYVTKLNPFAKWKVVQKEFDWNYLEAELAKISGYNGKTYSVRYSLLIAECEPGTKKVKGRIVLKSDVAFPVILHRIWAYIRCYMNNGATNLKANPRPTGISLTRCLLYYYPALDFTAEGGRRREQMNIVEWVFSIIVLIPLFWLFIPISFFEFIALKLAPEPKWPSEG